MSGPLPAGNTTSNLIQSANVTYFNKNFRENLKNRTPFLACATVLDQPLNAGINHRIFMYGDTSTGQPLAAKTGQASEGDVETGVTVDVLKADFVVGEWSDYANFSSLSLYTALDNVVVNVGKELAYRLAETLSAIVRVQADAAHVIDASAQVQLAAASLSSFTAISRGALASAIQSMAGRAIRPMGESYIGVIHPFAVGDLLADGSSVVDILKRTSEGLSRLEEIASGKISDVVEVPGVNCKFMQSSLVTTTPNYKSVSNLTGLRTYIFGDEGVYRVKFNAPGDTAYGDGEKEGIKVYLEQNAKPTSFDPAAMVPGWASYRVHMAAGLGPDKTARLRTIDAGSAIS